MFICEISIIILICQKLWSVGSAKQNIKLPPPNLKMIISLVIVKSISSWDAGCPNLMKTYL